MVEIEYSENELRQKIIKELEDEFEKQYRISDYDNDRINRNEEITNLNNGLNVKITYEIEDDIGTKVNVN